MVDEVWLDVVGYEGYYQVSNMGRVKSLERTVTKTVKGCQVSQKRQEQVLSINDDKYSLVVLCLNGSRRTAKVHRLVAEAFHPNPGDLATVNHVNGKKWDNRADNLEWCSNIDNMRHAYATGLNKGRNGDEQTQSKLSTVKVLLIRELAAKGTSQRKIAVTLGVSQKTIHNVLKGKNWTHV